MAVEDVKSHFLPRFQILDGRGSQPCGTSGGANQVSTLTGSDATWKPRMMGRPSCHVDVEAAALVVVG